jgi:hypothetical protein
MDQISIISAFLINLPVKVFGGHAGSGLARGRGEGSLRNGHITL